MPTLEELAALLCQLQDAKRIEFVKCLEDGSISIPKEIPCCGEKTANLSTSDMLALINAAKDPCCPENLDLLEQILNALLDDAETSNYTLLCSSADPTVSYLTWFEQPDELGAAITPYHIIVGTDTPIEGLPPDGVRCPDTKVVDTCYYTPGDPDVYYTRILCLAGSIILSVLWVYPDGTISTTSPLGAVPCSSEEARTVLSDLICGELATGGFESGFLESVYNQDGTLFATRTTDKRKIPTTYIDYELGSCPCSEDCLIENI